MFFTEGIILKKMPVGEADALVTAYTRNFGKIRGLAKGVCAEKAKLKGHVEPLSLSILGFVAGKNGERLTHASVYVPFFGIRGNEEKLLAGMRMADIVDRAALEGERDELVWEEILRSFVALEKDEWEEGGEKKKPALPLLSPRARIFFEEFKKRLGERLGYGEETEWDAPFGQREKGV